MRMPSKTAMPRALVVVLLVICILSGTSSLVVVCQLCVSKLAELDVVVHPAGSVCYVILW